MLASDGCESARVVRMTDDSTQRHVCHGLCSSSTVVTDGTGGDKRDSKAPHSKLGPTSWGGITEKGAPLPQVTDGAAFLPQQAGPSKLGGIQRRFF